MSGKIERHCEICSVPFTVYLSALKYGRGRFCSKACQNQWQAVPLEVRFRKYTSPHLTTNGCLLWLGPTNAGTPADNIADMVAKGRCRKRTIGSRRWHRDQRRTLCLSQ